MKQRNLPEQFIKIFCSGTMPRLSLTGEDYDGQFSLVEFFALAGATALNGLASKLQYVGQKATRHNPCYSKLAFTSLLIVVF
ncbi:hypothetical protein [Pedobacter kyonggii]|uniref:Uncharacterized protein n=1 Tax=Pedobacter kyonggii TaxID=1926871 RepID=A0A4Q9H9Z2_9SPHI|nr:hypothetical protein [Pedobacter kyonggii]TBO40601.1 hypothetical protein EYS08_18305 [Pedobacter kyonggii]